MKKFITEHVLIIITVMSVCAGGFSDGVPEPDMMLYGRITYGMDIVEDGEIDITLTPEGGSPVVVKDVLDKHLGPEPDLMEYSYKVKIPVECVLPGMSPSVGAVPLSDESVTYQRTVTVRAMDKTKSFQDEFQLGPHGQRGASERRDYNVKDYTLEEVIGAVLGRTPHDNIDINGDQQLDAGDVIKAINENG